MYTNVCLYIDLGALGSGIRESWADSELPGAGGFGQGSAARPMV